MSGEEKTRRALGPRLRLRNALVGAVMALATVLAACAVAHAAAKNCTAYGNPPATLFAAPTPICTGGALIGPWPDSDGTNRYACLYEPAAASPNNPLPLIVYLHPSLGTADTIQFTNLPAFMETANVSNDPARLGFILLSPEGRNTSHQYTSPDAFGLGWDNWYRQFLQDPTPPVPALNVDAAAIDHFIADEVASGKVDQERIYVTGWSNGAAMAYIYGLNRANIAAVGVYSAPDPWRYSIDPCEQRPVAGIAKNFRQIKVANPRVPTYQVHNGCDIAGLCPNALRMEKQLRKMGAPVADQIIGLSRDPTNPSNQQAAAKCFAVCGRRPNGDPTNGLGVPNHNRWPTQWTQSILDFFRANPLN